MCATCRQTRQSGFVSLGRSMFQIQYKQKSFDELLIHITGSVSVEDAVSVNNELLEILESQPLKNIQLDLGGLSYLDGAGMAVIRNFARNCNKLRNSITLLNIPSAAKRFLDQDQCPLYDDNSILEGIEGPGFVEQIGEGMVNLKQNTYDIISFLGGIVDAFSSGLRRPGSIKWEGFTKLFEKAGVDAVPIVVILSLLMGAILAFQAAIQLRKFGANIFVADLVSLSICLEMGPLLTALIISGRSGAGLCGPRRLHASFRRDRRFESARYRSLFVPCYPQNPSSGPRCAVPHNTGRYHGCDRRLSGSQLFTGCDADRLFQPGARRS